VPQIRVRGSDLKLLRGRMRERMPRGRQRYGGWPGVWKKKAQDTIKGRTRPEAVRRIRTESQKARVRMRRTGTETQVGKTQIRMGMEIGKSEQERWRSDNIKPNKVGNQRSENRTKTGGQSEAEGGRDLQMDSEDLVFRSSCTGSIVASLAVGCTHGGPGSGWLPME
jgi:hypothetical protein